MFRTKVCKCSFLCWIIFFVIGQIILIISSVLCLRVFSWVRTDFDTSFIYLVNDEEDFAYFEASSFKGSLLHCLKGCGKLNENSNYKKIKIDICNNYDDSEYFCNFHIDPDYNSVKSICKMFKHLEKTGLFKLIFDCISIAFILLWSIWMLLMKRIKCCYYLSLIASILSFLCLLTGSILWYIFNPIVFNDCSEIPKNGESPTICATEGLIITISVGILHFILVILYFIFACKAKNSERSKSNSDQQNNEEVPNLNNPQNNIDSAPQPQQNAKKRNQAYPRLSKPIIANRDYENNQDIIIDSD